MKWGAILDWDPCQRDHTGGRYARDQYFSLRFLASPIP